MEEDEEEGEEQEEEAEQELVALPLAVHEYEASGQYNNHYIVHSSLCQWCI